MIKKEQLALLNGVCPYFTMFPLSFPLSILKRHGKRGQVILDPFCGRGTTNYASRLLGYRSVGVDSSPVAVALSKAKIANATPNQIVKVAKNILKGKKEPTSLPEGEFWEWAYDSQTLNVICRLREALLEDCRSEARVALRAIILGALHGPKTKSIPSYFSNQAPRTYAPKPNYSVRYWKKHKLKPQRVDVLNIIKTRANRYYGDEVAAVGSNIYQANSTDETFYKKIKEEFKFDWIITSPPYYGMRTYLPDQWLRLWFLGGSTDVKYSMDGQLTHSGKKDFISGLNQVWKNVGEVAKSKAKLVIRFGAINDRDVDPLTLLKESLNDTDWRITTVKEAGSASLGRRQVLHFSENAKSALEEYDVWAIKN